MLGSAPGGRHLCGRKVLDGITAYFERSDFTRRRFLGLDLPIGRGFRVPCIVVSPWTAGGWVSSQKFDHTSVLQFLEKLTGVQEPNISQWRRETFGDLTSVFRHDHISKPPALPETGARLNLATYEAARLPAPTFPTSTQVVPHQERGGRHRL